MYFGYLQINEKSFQWPPGVVDSQVKDIVVIKLWVPVYFGYLQINEKSLQRPPGIVNGQMEV